MGTEDDNRLQGRVRMQTNLLVAGRRLTISGSVVLGMPPNRSLTALILLGMHKGWSAYKLGKHSAKTANLRVAATIFHTYSSPTYGMPPSDCGTSGLCGVQSAAAFP